MISWKMTEVNMWRMKYPGFTLPENKGGNMKKNQKMKEQHGVLNWK